MEIFPHIGVSDFKFEDSLMTIKNRLSKYKGIHEVSRVEMDKEYPSLLIEDIGLYIVFLQNGNRVRYFELEADVYHMSINLHTESLKRLSQVYKKLDKNLQNLGDEIDSLLFGSKPTLNYMLFGNSTRIL